MLHRENAQLVLVDTPGLHKPKTLLGERLNDLVRATWSEVDVIGLCIPADEPVGRGDRFIAAEIAELKATVIAVVTKTDLVGQGRGSPSSCSPCPGSATSPTSCRSRPSPATSSTCWCEVMAGHLPPSPRLYPDDMITDEPEQVMVAELIREAALEGVRDELPHSIAVVVEEMIPAEGRRPTSMTKIYADIYVERQSQKAIVIGAGGAPAARRRHPGPGRDRGAARHAGLPRPARPGGQGVAARPEAAAPARLLTR